jgi:hypothetical protein
MAYQNPAFYFQHAARVAQNADATPQPADATAEFNLFDDRQGEPLTFESGPGVDVQTERVDTPAANAIDTMIVSGHNWNGLDLDIIATEVGGGSPNPLLTGSTVTEADGVPIFREFAAAPISVWPVLKVQLLLGDTGTELTEIWWTQKRELTRGPEPHWDHSWRREQHQFTSQSGVTSTWLTGANRKRYSMTWRHLVGADRQVFLDLREQTDGWSRPFWMRPPDTIYPTLLMELDRDSDWRQDFDSPLDSGTSDAITMPLIEVLG